ncbi:glycosyltransferase family 4 protein [Bosea rubneri]|uniref:Glycosyltransferase family 4 protein n=1 Tax=Bosea rubneri TaxID=3075434 RepID=A0ABU3SGS6_9HYPH|nr:glycosyltransferase family 4 protein [Bosea sp. ZW T0_25]MDU0343982.1 glycosyltransferase family 4 protein [Bosea sp. ZW T0_25]
MLDIAFLVAGVGISGGTNTILEHAANIAQLGNRVTLVTLNKCSPSALAWHPNAQHLATLGVRVIHIDEVGKRAFDVAIATFWATVFHMWKINSESYLYYVQSIESRFPSEDEVDLKLLIDSTYEMGLGLITVASWMTRYLQQVHGQTASLALNGIRKDIFNAGVRPTQVRPQNGPRLLVEGPFDVAFKNVPNTLAACRDAGFQDVWLVTNDRIDPTVGGVGRVFQHVPMAQMNEIYGSCDVLVKLSLVEGMFGPPLEMFHCGGTAVVFDVTGHDEYIKDGVNGIVVQTGNYSRVSDALRKLRSRPEILQRLQMNALRTASEWPDWQQSSACFMNSIEDARGRATVTQSQLRNICWRLWALFQTGRRLRAEEREKSQAAACTSRSLEVAAHTARNIEAEILDAVYRSNSWRMTSPLRAIMRSIYKVTGRAG